MRWRVEDEVKGVVPTCDVSFLASMTGGMFSFLVIFSSTSSCASSSSWTSAVGTPKGHQRVGTPE